VLTVDARMGVTPCTSMYEQRCRGWSLRVCEGWGGGLALLRPATIIPAHPTCHPTPPPHTHTSCRIVQGLCHAFLLDAGSGDGAATRFSAFMNQLPAHFGGDHSGCTFHPSWVCDGTCNAKKVMCPRRVCSCGKGCSPDNNLQCRGRPQDATCVAAKRYQSKLPPVTCPYHLQRIRDEVKACVDHAPSLLVEEAGVGKVHTCKNESIHARVSQACAKGTAIVRETTATWVVLDN
jgi:hypothetical protein